MNYTDSPTQLQLLLRELTSLKQLSPRTFLQLLKKYPKANGNLFSKSEALREYRQSFHDGFHEKDILQILQKKPTRTLSGVTPVTVLTKPFPCPGKCIFCPNDIRMPKSYLANEPGAQRAERNSFDPYLQTYNRLLAFQNIGHTTDKIELIVLGGTWSYYPEAYQIWFIKECFRALNDFGQSRDGREKVEQRYREMRVTLQRSNDLTPTNDPQHNKKLLTQKEIHGGVPHSSYNAVVSEIYTAPEKIGGFDQYQRATWNELLEQQKENEESVCRNVGLVIETRPDNISKEEVIRIRKLGCTKTQIGFQSLQDDVLEKNKRGHDVAATRRAVQLLRQAGFKIHAHWMPNLYGSSVVGDKRDYDLLFGDPDFQPDELKIYPCSLIESAELMQFYQRGEWQPYTEEELLDVLTYCFRHTPEYCRLTRVIRDIPSTDIVVGNKKTNFREIAEQKLKTLGEHSRDIRAREIRKERVTIGDVTLDEVTYTTSVSTEVFLQYVKKADDVKKIVGFLRLSLPTVPGFIEELKDTAIIREVHVYGQVVGLGRKVRGNAQHLGLGTLLIERAKELAVHHHFQKLAVISAIGTRQYYRQRGFTDGELYQIASLTT